MDSRNAREYHVCIGSEKCPKALHGQFKRSTHKYPTLMLEAVADQKLWIWHAYFGVPGANNDLNVLYGSPLFDDEIADIAPESWSTFVKTFPVAMDEKSLKFKRVQEAARKEQIIETDHCESNKVVGIEVNFKILFVNPATEHCLDDWVERCDLHVRKTKELRDRKTHNELRKDLVEHLWNNDDE
ncbi:zinc finger, CCHC-type containing protein [Tanacetum coccineum]